jgi:phosphomannomutase
MLAEAIRSGLVAVGRTVIDADVAATPTVGILVRDHQCAGGIQISASHNPPEYNGLKLIAPEGRVIGAAAGEAVLQHYCEAEPDWVAHDSLGKVEPLSNTLNAHCRHILDTVDVKRIRRKGYVVLLDANHGAGSLLGRRLLVDLGCEVTVLGDVPDGKFRHGAEPLAENLVDVQPAVVEAGADVGFCQDPDADRLAVIDEAGRYLGEEYTLAMCLDHVLRSTPGPVVTNCSSSRMNQDVAARHSSPLFLSPVGEVHVAEMMLDKKAVFGGEGNGGTIDPQVGYIRDSFVGMARLLEAMAVRGAKISALADELPRYAIHKTKVTLPREQIPATLDRLEKLFADAQPNRLDGLRLDWPTSWLLVRPSNTEPIVRVIAEAHTLDDAKRLCDEADKAIRARTA